MKIEARSKAEEVTSPVHDGYVINHHETDQLIGKLLTLVETMGLPEKQEKSFKDLAKQSIRGSLDSHRNNFCGGGLLIAAMRLNEELHQECIKNPPELDMGYSPRDGEYVITFTSKN